MRPRKLRRRTLLLLCALLCLRFVTPPLDAQTRNNGANQPGVIPGKHRGAVTALLRDGQGRILSAGEDGFLGIWNNQAAIERFQLCPNVIQQMVLRPGKPEISIIESDGLGLYRISAWNYETKKNLFTLRFRDSISYINYSAAGSFLIVARSGRTGVAFIHAETGEVLESPGELSGSIAFAATSRSERVMICYLSSGILSYWDLEAGTELQHFDVPPNIRNPVLFGNYCFLGGFDSQGLVILDAVTGTLIARDQNLKQGILFIDNPEPAENRGSVQFHCAALSGSGSSGNVVYRMEINITGRLTTTSRRNVPANAGISVSGSGNLVSSGNPVSSGNLIVSTGNGNYILGTGTGTLWSLASISRELQTGNPGRVSDIAASTSAVAFLSEGGELGFIPLDFSQLKEDSVVMLESTSDGRTGGGSGAYNSIISADNSRFVLWQSGSNRSVPMMTTLSGSPVEANTSRISLDSLSSRFPIRSAGALGNNLLFLDTAGTVYILDSESGAQRFSYTAAGAVDAAFIRDDTIILGRSGAAGGSTAGNTPFITINTATGETVPMTYPAMVGVRVYMGSSGAIYGAVVNQSAGNTQTSIIQLNSSNPAQSERLIEYNGEDAVFTMAESGGNLASTLGSNGATIYRSSRPTNRSQNSVNEIIPVERSQGLPVKIIDGRRWFIILDGDGGIAWHDNRTGELKAVFRLYPNLWILESNGQILQGKTGRK